MFPRPVQRNALSGVRLIALKDICLPGRYVHDTPYLEKVSILFDEINNYQLIIQYKRIILIAQ